MLASWKLTPLIVRPMLSGRTSVVSHPFERGRVITFCFRITSVGTDTTNQMHFTKLLHRVLADTTLKPLVDTTSLEMTIVPQDKGGLLIGARNPRAETIHAPIRFPHHTAPDITPIYVPFGGSVSANHIVLPPRSWIVFGVK